jgi:hypothetical protein
MIRFRGSAGQMSLNTVRATDLIVSASQLLRRFVAWPMILGLKKKSASGSSVPSGLVMLPVNASFHCASISSRSGQASIDSSSRYIANVGACSRRSPPGRATGIAERRNDSNAGIVQAVDGSVGSDRPPGSRSVSCRKPSSKLDNRAPRLIHGSSGSSPPPESQADVRPSAATSSWMFWIAAPSEQRKIDSLFARYSASLSPVVASGKQAFHRGSPRTKMIAMVLTK